MESVTNSVSAGIDVASPHLAPPKDASDRYLRGLERLVPVVQELSLARSLDAIMQTVRRAARELTGADGATFVLRDREFCFYAEEDAIEPLWKGLRFPLERCISGWTMIHRQPAVIEDIYADPRIPAEAYRPTFVRSLCMVPIRTMAPVGAIGNYWAKRHQPSDDEVKLLGALADSTSIAMENVALYTTLEERVEERTSALAASRAELAEKHESLVRAEQQKQEMASLLVHDLKSPASSILMLCRARLRAAGIGDKERKSWRMAEAAAEVVHRLALNILDVSRSEEGVFAPKVAPLDLRQLLTDVVDLMSPLVEGRSQSLELHVDLEDDVVHADGELLRRVLQNLIDNAVRHSPAGTAVRLDARTSGGMTEIRVIDEGLGVPAELRRRIFDKYTRADDGGQAGDSTGRGLGLAFCRLAVESHGGQILLDENTPRGSIFTVRLPARASASAA